MSVQSLITTQAHAAYFTALSNVAERVALNTPAAPEGFPQQLTHGDAEAWRQAVNRLSERAEQDGYYTGMYRIAREIVKAQAHCADREWAEMLEAAHAATLTWAYSYEHTEEEWFIAPHSAAAYMSACAVVAGLLGDRKGMPLARMYAGRARAWECAEKILAAQVEALPSGADRGECPEVWRHAAAGALAQAGKDMAGDRPVLVMAQAHQAWQFVVRALA